MSWVLWLINGSGNNSLCVCVRWETEKGRGRQRDRLGNFWFFTTRMLQCTFCPCLSQNMCKNSPRVNTKKRKAWFQGIFMFTFIRYCQIAFKNGLPIYTPTSHKLITFPDILANIFYYQPYYSWPIWCT